MKSTAAIIDVASIRCDVEQSYIAAQTLKDFRGNGRGRAIRAVCYDVLSCQA